MNPNKLPIYLSSGQVVTTTVSALEEPNFESIDMGLVDLRRMKVKRVSFCKEDSGIEIELELKSNSNIARFRIPPNQLEALLKDFEVSEPVKLLGFSVLRYHTNGREFETGISRDLLSAPSYYTADLG